MSEIYDAVMEIREGLQDIARTLSSIVPQEPPEHTCPWAWGQWICPHCNHPNRIAVSLRNHLPHELEFECCSSDDGGCDRKFVIRPIVEFEVKVEVFTIEKVK